MSTEASADKNISFYVNEPPINSDVETFFVNHASIPSSALREHLINIRQRAWEKRNYPCLGRWAFLDFSIQQSPIYQEILDQCKNHGATLIDFGCCLGQDIRQLVYDGVHLDRLRGYDLESFFIELGYELFCDGEVMKENKIFTVGDIFDDDFLNGVEPADYVYVGAFIHLFDTPTQREVCRRLTRLAKRAITGRQVGASIPGEYSRTFDFPSSKSMRHSPETFTQMWNEVTECAWQVESAYLKTAYNMKSTNERLTFVVRSHEQK
ncbi:unnamed protein product [Rotaria socialis]|uniref:Methyltransferase domain-containing protein n=1 Tax=Rotaria socialis TaxID=392032 RepID=A0A821NZH0_9BILA|nr:unnamed protein product [Rotaria socialis]CAF4793938.1 unnamed protein product [Rotaria socialis]